MHSPGVCGVILASGSRIGAGDPKQKTKAEDLNELISALNADTEMILVAAGADGDALAPVVWARAGYMVKVAATASAPEVLRVMLQEVMNRGRDAAVVTWLDGQAVTAETVHGMVSTYCQAGDEIWAVAPEQDKTQGHPMLLGRRMIEVFLRGNKLSTADEILATNREHVRTMNAGDQAASMDDASSEKAWVAPWDL
jgi:CTP:molybdopterin cytidylyltransferase MocA